MKKLFTILSGVVAGFALAGAVALTGNLLGGNQVFANPEALACIKTDGPIKVNKENANVSVKLDNCAKKDSPRKFVMKSYYAPDALGGVHGDQQVLFDVTNSPVTVRNNGVWNKIHVRMFGQEEKRDCFYQVDLVDVTNDQPKNPIVAAAVGGSVDCRPDQTHLYACTAFGLSPGATENEVKISTFATQTTNATFTGVTVNWGDGTPAFNAPTALNLSHLYDVANITEAKTFNVSVIAHFTYTGRFGGIHNVSAPACGGPVTFNPIPEEETPIYVCEISTKRIIQILESQYGTPQYPLDKYTTDLSKCVQKYMNVCELSTKTFINIKEEEFDASKHSTDVTKCVTPPTTPPTSTPPAVLAKTGAGSTIALAGAVSLVAALAHSMWRRNRA